MKRSFVGSLLALVALALVTTGCVHRTNSMAFSAPRGKTVALSVTVDGSGTPSASQMVAVVKAVEPHLTAAGWRIVTDYAAADSILRVDFTPDPSDPQNVGRAVALNFRANPLKAL
ncbi:MAG TPA: hypothetical protein VM029_04250, partial [Opitutaceae bacterium]|nr:hypothetical protein [Opitutaceae bacterium]